MLIHGTLLVCLFCGIHRTKNITLSLLLKNYFSAMGFFLTQCDKAKVNSLYSKSYYLTSQVIPRLDDTKK